MPKKTTPLVPKDFTAYLQTPEGDEYTLEITTPDPEDGSLTLILPDPAVFKITPDSWIRLVKNS